jgi:hypothetical protein
MVITVEVDPTMSLTATLMAKKRKDAPPPSPNPGRPKGRPKGAGRITLRYAIVTTPEYRAWMEGFMAHLSESEVSDVYRDAIRHYAEAKGFRQPPSR